MIQKYYQLARNELFKLNRSLTGEGVKKTLKIIQKEVPELILKKKKSGSKVFDWKIPNEWNVKNAYILDKNKQKIVDFKKHNLHIVGYSHKVNKKLKKNELLKKLFFIKNQPEAIPYITSYYNKMWGFCVSYNQYKKILKDYKKDDKFTVLIDSELNSHGELDYGEVLIKGKSKKEILISTYICHPSMANNELSGIIVMMGLINFFKKKKLNKSLRFLLIPETIGSINYIRDNLRNLKKNVIGGYILSCIGDERNHSCMFSKYKNSPSDEAIIGAYKKLKIKKFKIHSFLKRGSDERQFNSPGVDLKISSIFRTKYQEYKEYHTSLDNFDLVTLKGCQGGFEVAKEAIKILQKNLYPENNLLCEPHMSKRKMYASLSRNTIDRISQKYMDFLQYADGTNSIQNISKLINISYGEALKINNKLLKKKLIKF